MNGPRWAVSIMDDNCEDLIIGMFDTFKEAFECLRIKYPYMYSVETNKYRYIYQTDCGSNIYVSIWDRKELPYVYRCRTRKLRQPNR